MIAKTHEVPIARPYFRGHEGEALAEVIASGWVSQGPRVQAFEQAFAERVGAAEAVATTSCTTAMQLALYALGVRPGRRGDRALALLHRHRQLCLALRRHARCSPTSTRSPTTSTQRRPSGRSRAARRPSCPFTSSDCPPTWTRSSRSPSGTAWRWWRTPPARWARPTGLGRSARSARSPASRSMPARCSPRARAA